MRDLEEIFTYDHLNRLTGITLNGSPTGDMGYDPYGRMKNKVSDNAFVFSAAVYDWTSKPHAIDAAKTRPGVFPDERQRITYTCFDKVKTIEEDGKTLEYAYGHDRQRIGMTEQANGVVRTKRYAGRCEFVTRTEGDSTSRVIYTFLTAPTGVFAVVEQREGFRPDVYYVFKDHLGSWTTITDAHGTVEREQSFDAWGNMRDPDTWTGTVTQQPMFDRGYTGHEHLNAFGLINMNGRMYDPVMSSFLSVDKYVSQPDNSQSFNRYTYCLNNPLKYIDPSGWQPIGGLKPKNPFHDNWSASYSRHAYEPRDFRNATNLWNMMLYGNLLGPYCAGGVGGASGSGGAVSMSDLQGTYGYHAAYQSNSVYNYTFPCTKLQLIRNWQYNPCYRTNSDIREAGITDLTVGVVNYGNGYQKSYYSWAASSKTHTASALDYVECSTMDYYGMSIQPLEKYGERNRQLNKANLLAQSLGIPFGTIQNGMECAAKAYHNVPVLTGKLTQPQYVNAMTRVGVGTLKAVRGLGYTCGGVAVVISGYQTIDYYVQGGEGPAVFFKGLADVGMVAVGLFGGPIGLGLSISYFVLDVSTDGFGVSYEVKP